MNRSSLLLILSLLIITTAALLFINKQNEQPSLSVQPPFSNTTEGKTKLPAPARYKAQDFDLAGKLKGLTAKQINEHVT